jgi:zinc protease
VIISERQGNENNPMFRLDEEMQAAAFRVHSYHHEVIGDMADLESLSRDDLYNHYRSFYVPNNAILCLAGDFDSRRMLARIKALYGDIPAGEEPVRVARPEPAQAGERRITVEGPGETTFIRLGYRAPVATNPDFFPLMVLDSLLAGASSLNMFGGGISNRTSRLYRELIEKDYAVSVSGALLATIDPFLYSLTIVTHPTRTVDEVLAAIDEQIAAVQAQPPTQAEIERAVKQARALFAYGSESITNQAFWLGFAEIFADYNWFLSYVDKLAEVTPEDVQRVAQQYLAAQNRTVGIYLPTGMGELETWDE